MTRVEVTHSAQTGGMTLAQIEAWCTEARNKGIPGDTVPTVAMRSTRQLRLLSASALAQDSRPIAAAEVLVTAGGTPRPRGTASSVRGGSCGRSG